MRSSAVSTRAMIKLFKIKDQKREDAANSSGRAPVKKQSAGELRLHKDISELNLPKSTVISFPNGKDDLMNFEISIRPDEGYYQGGTFVFTFQVSPSYPHEPPKVKCKTKVYHPNIDLEGNVCLNILREDWKPVLNINTVIYGLILLFMQPNDEDPLNHDAAAVLRDNPRLFETNVRRAMAGGYTGELKTQIDVRPPLTRLMSMSRVRTTADGFVSTRPKCWPRSPRRLLSCRPFGWPPSLPPVPPPLVGDFAQLPGYLMAGGNFLGRVISYVVNELVVDGLANNRTFQRFAVRTSKAIEDVSTKAAQARERLVAQLKDTTKDDDSFRRP
ncbi:hypothetical protein OPV22_026663 [Ensete ventricosum]|uniref:UBC core domain-containing protein n=1 Tax=Ensete ventricosum TaxID=4639 RepID=A0AAV8PVD6_ENSVE|nr:hypothetical protein OPV22_026663 [Ensete ventricosum]